MEGEYSVMSIYVFHPSCSDLWSIDKLTKHYGVLNKSGGTKLIYITDRYACNLLTRVARTLLLRTIIHKPVHLG